MTVRGMASAHMAQHRISGLGQANAVRSINRLASGFRVNNAADDAAGLAVSERMRGQIGGLDRASENAQHAVSLIQTAEGAMGSAHSILGRMRGLAVQSSNQALSDQDRSMISREFTQLQSELDRISTSTNFNQIPLLDGNLGGAMGAQGVRNMGINEITFTGEVEGDVRFVISRQDGETAISAALGGSVISQNINELREPQRAAASDLDNGLGEIGVPVDAAASNVRMAGDGAAPASGNAVPGRSAISQAVLREDQNVMFDFGEGRTVTVNFNDIGSLREGVISNVQLNDGGVDISRAVSVDNTNGLRFQIGANANQSATLNIRNVSSLGLDVHDLNIGNAQGAMDAIRAVDGAINALSGERANLGAMQNRMEHTVNSLGLFRENLTASESRIRDADMAREIMNVARQQIMAQASLAMMAQTADIPRSNMMMMLMW